MTRHALAGGCGYVWPLEPALPPGMTLVCICYEPFKQRLISLSDYWRIDLADRPRPGTAVVDYLRSIEASP